MFWHLFKYRLKIILRDKELLFWTLIFPIILTTFFNLAFKGLYDDKLFEVIPMAIVENESYQNDEILKEVLDAVSTSDDRLFDLQKGTKEELDQKLENDEIKGYIIDDRIVVKVEGMEQTIIKSFLDEYKQKKATIENVMKENNYQVDMAMVQDILNTKDFIEHSSYSNEEPNLVVNYFYTAIGMTCLYAAFWSCKEIRDIQANQSKRAARLNVTPVNKMKILLSNFLATITINIGIILIVLAYIMFGLKVDFGDSIAYIILTCVVGIITGTMMGALIGIVSKQKEGMKTGLVIGTTMTFSFLAGMMYSDMKYLINTNIPILGYINPVNLVTDALYALYYYDTLDRFILNISLLCIISVILAIASFLVIRRQKYESI